MFHNAVRELKCDVETEIICLQRWILDQVRAGKVNFRIEHLQRREGEEILTIDKQLNLFHLDNFHPFLRHSPRKLQLLASQIRCII